MAHTLYTLVVHPGLVLKQKQNELGNGLLTCLGNSGEVHNRSSHTSAAVQRAWNKLRSFRLLSTVHNKPKSANLTLKLLTFYIKGTSPALFRLLLPLWDTCGKVQKDELQKLQSRTARVITGANYEIRSRYILNQ